MPLLLQLNGDLPERFPTHERRLWLFGCRRRTCRRRDGSIRVMRGVRVAEIDEGTIPSETPTVKENNKPPPSTPAAAAQAPAAPTLGERLFGATSSLGGGGARNPFATGSKPSNPFSPAPKKTEPEPAPRPAAAETSLSPAAPAPASEVGLPETFAKVVSLHDQSPAGGQRPPTALPSPEPWPTDAAALPPQYPVSYLVDAEYEVLDPEPANPSRNAAASGNMEVDSSPPEGKQDKDVFESNMDSAFQRFADRVGQNPEQAIRYEFAGAPLLYSRADATGRLLAAPSGGTTKVGTAGGMPRCGICGGPRCFEVQLMPNAIAELESEEPGTDGMEWGTVIVGVCKADCVPPSAAGSSDVGYAEEWAGVQWEELKGN